MAVNESPVPSWGIGALFLGLIVVVVVVILLASSIAIIGPGERGVVLKFGQVQPIVLGEGLHFITPIQDSVVKMDVKTLKFEAESTAASRDLQDTHTKVALNFHIVPERSNEILQTLGNAYWETYISPAIQEVVKATTAEFTAEELITKRSSVKSNIEEALKARLAPRGIIVETVSITDFQFSPEFTSAIEAKVTAQQKALEQENNVKIFEALAKQKIAEAEGERQSKILRAEGDAEATRLIQEQLKQSPQYIDYLKAQAILQRWDGKYPSVMLGNNAIPLLQLPGSTVG